MVIKIQCGQAIGEAIMNTLAAIREVATSNHPNGLFNEELFSVSVGADPVQREEAAPDPSKARVQYRALLPRAKKDREKTIEVNLAQLGATTMHGVIYRDLVNATLEGKMLTEPYIAQVRSLKRGSSQRVIGDLARQGLIEKVPVVGG